MLNILHRTAALAAIGLIGLFFISTLTVETIGGPERIAWLKQLIVTPGLWLLIPTLAAAGISGTLLARGRGNAIIAAKRRRMVAAAGNGLLVLMPCALALDRLASQGSMDGTFYAVQGIELLAGVINLTLLGLNLRDGLRLGSGYLPAAV